MWRIDDPDQWILMDYLDAFPCNKKLLDMNLTERCDYRKKKTKKSTENGVPEYQVFFFMRIRVQ